MKKYIITFLALIVVNCLIVPAVFAEPSVGSKDALIGGRVVREYMFHIPSNYVIPTNSKSANIGNVSVEKMTPYPGEVIQVKLVTDGKLTHETHGNSKISFQSSFKEVKVAQEEVGTKYPVTIIMDNNELGIASNGRYSANLKFEACFYDTTTKTTDKSSITTNSCKISLQVINNSSQIPATIEGPELIDIEDNTPPKTTIDSKGNTTVVQTSDSTNVAQYIAAISAGLLGLLVLFRKKF